MHKIPNSLFDSLLFEALKVTESAALACFPTIGKGNEKEADKAAVDAMRKAFDHMPIKGRVVIGEGERDEAPMLFIGEKVGKQVGPEIDIAVDPLEGTTLTAKARPNAICVMALAERGNLLHAPDVYMEKIAIGPNLPEDLVNINKEPKQNIAALAKAKGKKIEDLVVCILERPRHEVLLTKVRETGAKVMLISDGDVYAVMASAMPEGGIDLYMGSGGAPEGVLAAAALRTLGGQMQGKLLFKNDSEKERAFKLGIKELDHVYTQDELAKGDVLFVATGVTSGPLLQGIRKIENNIVLESIIFHAHTKSQHRINSIYKTL